MNTYFIGFMSGYLLQWMNIVPLIGGVGIGIMLHRTFGDSMMPDTDHYLEMALSYMDKSKRNM